MHVCVVMVQSGVGKVIMLCTAVVSLTDTSNVSVNCRRCNVFILLLILLCLYQSWPIYYELFIPVFVNYR